MRRLVAVLLVLALAGCHAPAPPAPAPPVPSVVATTRVSDRIRDLTIRSPAVGRDVAVRLLVPAGFDRDTTARYPVLYLLHGASDSQIGWTRSTDVAAMVAGTPVLVVMPDGGRAGFYSDWRRGPRWETFHLVELWQLLRARYRASDVRAVAGLSMGGLGTLDYAARHPGMFRAAASFSAIADTRLSPGESDAYRNLVRSAGADPDDLWGDPVDEAAVWAAHNPYDLAPGLKGTALFVSVGNGAPGPLDPRGARPDSLEASLRDENVALVGRLRSLGIPVEFDDYGPGTHSWPYWQRELHRAWPMLEAALTTP
jgi:diacylglycerol O-acyltransferase / trehalose O-mycolyltransferase / mycolyltransferase Ag85